MIEFGTKAAGEELTLTWLPDELADGDAISGFTVSAISPATITIDDEATTDTQATFTAAGGVAGEIAYISLEVTTDDGETIEDVGRITIVDESEGEIITPGELRAELRDVPDSDATLLRLIVDAREYVEKETGKITVAREIVDILDAWPASNELGWWDGSRDGAIGAGAPNYVELQQQPVLSITKVETLDSAGAATTWAATNYILDNRSNVHRIVLKPGSVWPYVGLPAAGIAITYQAGYSDPANIPGMFKRATLQIAAHWYENRELASPDAANRVPLSAQAILERLRVRRLV